MSIRNPAPRPTGRHRSRLSARTVTPSLPRLSIPLLVAICFAGVGAVGASAASLGGLTTADLGAADATVAAHPTGVNAQWLPVRSGTNWILNGITLSTAAGEPFTNGERLKLEHCRHFRLSSVRDLLHPLRHLDDHDDHAKHNRHPLRRGRHQCHRD